MKRYIHTTEPYTRDTRLHTQELHNLKEKNYYAPNSQRKRIKIFKVYSWIIQNRRTNHSLLIKNWSSTGTRFITFLCALSYVPSMCLRIFHNTVSEKHLRNIKTIAPRLYFLFTKFQTEISYQLSFCNHKISIQIVCSTYVSSIFNQPTNDVNDIIIKKILHSYKS